MLFSQFFKMESKNSKPEKEPDSSLATTFEELGLSGDNQELEQIAAAIEKEELTLEAEAKKLSQLKYKFYDAEKIKQPLKKGICKSTKNAKPEEKPEERPEESFSATTVAEFGLPDKNQAAQKTTAGIDKGELKFQEDNQEHEMIAAAIKKKEFTGEAEAKKTSKLSENICDVDTIIQPLNDEICKCNKDAEQKNQNDSPQATTFTEELEPIFEEFSLQGEAKMISKVDENTIQTVNKICKITKTAIPEESSEKNTLGATFAEFILPEKNPELEKIVAAVEKGESTLEGGALKILKLAENVCDLDKILSTLTEEICKRTKSNAVPVLMYMAISEGLQHIFNIGSGAAKLDFTAIRYFYLIH
jgi:hypothetical protein